LKETLSAKLDIKNLSFEELNDFLKNLNQTLYRTIQIFRWLYLKGVYDFYEMTDLSNPLREALYNKFFIYKAEILEKQLSRDGTIKFLLRLNDKGLIECVLIRQKDRNTLCISTQIGCRFKCSFCASSLRGFIRDLKCSEILEQYLIVKNDLGTERINNIVFMGMGEPLDNIENLIKAIRILNSKYGQNIGIRKITISTCGLVRGIKKLIASGIAPELSISLNAPEDEIRNRLMPINRRFNIKELLKIAEEYTQNTKRLITFEYILIKGVNDLPAYARRLSSLLKGLKCKLNLIIYNKVGALAYEGSNAARIKYFYNILKNNKIPVTLRHSRGEDIDAACGQLVLRFSDGTL